MQSRPIIAAVGNADLHRSLETWSRWGDRSRTTNDYVHKPGTAPRLREVKVGHANRAGAQIDHGE